MNRNTWQSLDQLLEEALDLPPAQRHTWLASLGSEFDELRPTLQRLLSRAAEVETSDFLETLPDIELSAASSFLDEQARSDLSVGPYRLIREIGVGGMGAVWLAEKTDGLLARKVALKLPRLASPDSELWQRAEREREILGALAHPNIARLYDAGISESGQPYLALEYVKGTPIDQFCESNELGLNQRLELFVQVADAVAYAHNQLVVHRDLKPGNILVTAKGQVSLLDFGIAKLLDESMQAQSDLTRPAVRVLTPDYASPEQITGQPLTVASDVYSLGVLLFELLTGKRPYSLRSNSAAGLERAIQQTRIPAPSSTAANPKFSKQLRGDLDKVVLKALSIDPGQRYGTVAQLIADLRRFHNGFPVRARPAGKLYRLKKFASRNRGGVAAGVCMLGAILLGSAVAIWQASVAIAEKERAEQIKDFIASIFRDANPYATQPSSKDGLTPLDLLNQAQTRLNEMADLEPGTRIELLNTLVASLNSLQNLTEAEALARSTVDEAIQLLGRDHPLTLMARAQLVELIYPTGQLPAIREEVEDLLATVRRRPDLDPQILLGVFNGRVHLANQEGDHALAITLAEQAIRLATEVYGPSSSQALNFATILALNYQRLGNQEASLAAAERVYRLTHGQPGAETLTPSARDARLMYGMALCEVRQYQVGLAHIAAAISATEQSSWGSPQNLGFFLNHQGRYQTRAGMVREARKSFERSAELLGDSPGVDTENYRAARLTVSRILLAGRWAQEALEVAMQLLDATKTSDVSADRIALIRIAAAAAAAYSGELAEARNYLKTVPFKSSPRRAGSFMDPVFVTALVERMSGNYAIAIEHLESLIAAAQPITKETRNVMVIYAELGRNLVSLGRLEQAEEVLQEALGRFDYMQPTVTPIRSEAMMSLGQIYSKTGRHTEALKVLQAADAFWLDFGPQTRWAGLAAFYLSNTLAELGRNADSVVLRRRAQARLEAAGHPADAAILVELKDTKG